MISRTAAGLALTLLFFGTAAARRGAAQPPASASVTVTETQNGKTVTVRPGGTLFVRLEANRTTGYSWTAQGLDAKVLQPIGKPAYEVSSPGRPGVPGHQLLQFRAVG